MQQIRPLESLISDLADILRIEKSRLLKGDFRDLKHISDRKNEYINTLNVYATEPKYAQNIRLHASKIKQIMKSASENESLLSAAKMGAASAQSHVKDLLNRDSKVGTYTEQGAKLRTHNASVTRSITA